MKKIASFLQKIRFCLGFGATTKDSLLLILLTINYILVIRSKTKRLHLQSDERVYKLKANYNHKTFSLHFRRQDISMLYEVWMDQSYKLEESKISNGVILDIGAHIGFTALYYWTQLSSDHHFISIEGSRKNAIILKQNIKIIPQHTIHQSIITSNGRTIRFYDEMSGHLHLVHKTLGQLHESETIDSLLSIEDSKIALCKMDIEGMEYEVLSQNNQWLTKVDQFYLELHDEDEYVKIKDCLLKVGLKVESDQSILYFARESK